MGFTIVKLNSSKKEWTNIICYLLEPMLLLKSSLGCRCCLQQDCVDLSDNIDRPVVVLLGENALNGALDFLRVVDQGLELRLHLHDLALQVLELW